MVLCWNAFLCVNAMIGNIDQYPKYVVIKFNQSYLSSSVTTFESKGKIICTFLTPRNIVRI